MCARECGPAAVSAAWNASDDLLYPDAVADAVAAFQAHPDVDVVHGHAVCVDERGQFIRYFHETQPLTPEVLYNYGPFISQPSTFFRRSIYETVGGLDPTLHYGLDWDLWCRFAKAGARFQLIPRLWSAMRIHTTAKSVVGGGKRLRELHAVNRRHKSRLLPVAAVGLAYGEYVRRRIAWLDIPLRSVWSCVSRQKGFLQSEIEGLRHPNLIVRSSAAIRVPRYTTMGGAHLLLDVGRSAAAAVSATVNGHAPEGVKVSGRRWEAHWTFEPAVRTDVADARIAVKDFGDTMRIQVLSFHTGETESTKKV